MAVNLITGYDLNRTPQEYLGWGHPIKYTKINFQSGNNLPLYDDSEYPTY